MKGIKQKKKKKSITSTFKTNFHEINLLCFFLPLPYCFIFICRKLSERLSINNNYRNNLIFIIFKLQLQFLSQGLFRSFLILFSRKSEHSMLTTAFWQFTFLFHWLQDNRLTRSYCRKAPLKHYVPQQSAQHHRGPSYLLPRVVCCRKNQKCLI